MTNLTPNTWLPIETLPASSDVVLWGYDFDCLNGRFLGTSLRLADTDDSGRVQFFVDSDGDAWNADSNFQPMGWIPVPSISQHDRPPDRLPRTPSKSGGSPFGAPRLFLSGAENTGTEIAAYGIMCPSEEGIKTFTLEPGEAKVGDINIAEFSDQGIGIDTSTQKQIHRNTNALS